jgi:hypothetical protein
MKKQMIDISAEIKNFEFWIIKDLLNLADQLRDDPYLSEVDRQLEILVDNIKVYQNAKLLASVNRRNATDKT